MYPRNKYWKPLVSFLLNNKLETEQFIAPEVLQFEFPNIFPYQVLSNINLNNYNFEWIVFHKKLSEDLTNEYLDLIQKEYKPVWGNHLFVVFKKHRTKKQAIKVVADILYTKINFSKYRKNHDAQMGILITTYNRPNYLKKLLHQLLEVNEEILVVNDGSDAKHQTAYSDIKKEFNNCMFIDNPKNMGLPYSLNVGFSYFLANPSVNWVHYIQDDVVLTKGFIEVMNKVSDDNLYPVITAFKGPHKIVKRQQINGVEVQLLLSAPAVHLLLHRQYLQDNLPIPTPYLGAPKKDKGKPGQGSDVDWWLLSWSPNSIVKQGKHIICIPNLSSTYALGVESTWNF